MTDYRSDTTGTDPANADRDDETLFQSDDETGGLAETGDAEADLEEDDGLEVEEDDATTTSETGGSGY